MDVRPGGGVGEAQPPQRPEQTRGGVLRPPQEPQVPELLPFPYFSRRPTRVRPKYRNRSVSKYREGEFTGPRFGCGRRAARRGHALPQHSKGSVRRRRLRAADTGRSSSASRGSAAGAPRPALFAGPAVGHPLQAGRQRARELQGLLH